MAGNGFNSSLEDISVRYSETLYGIMVSMKHPNYTKGHLAVGPFDVFHTLPE